MKIRLQGRPAWRAGRELARSAAAWLLALLCVAAVSTTLASATAADVDSAAVAIDEAAVSRKVRATCRVCCSRLRKATGEGVVMCDRRREAPGVRESNTGSSHRQAPLRHARLFIAAGTLEVTFSPVHEMPEDVGQPAEEAAHLFGDARSEVVEYQHLRCTVHGPPPFIGCPAYAASKIRAGGQGLSEAR